MSILKKVDIRNALEGLENSKEWAMIFVKRILEKLKDKRKEYNN